MPEMAGVAASMDGIASQPLMKHGADLGEARDQ